MKLRALIKVICIESAIKVIYTQQANINDRLEFGHILCYRRKHKFFNTQTPAKFAKESCQN